MAASREELLVVSQEILTRFARLEREIEELRRLIVKVLVLPPIQPTSGVVRRINCPPDDLPKLVEGLHRLAKGDVQRRSEFASEWHAFVPSFTPGQLVAGRRIRNEFARATQDIFEEGMLDLYRRALAASLARAMKRFIRQHLPPSPAARGRT